MTICCVSDTHTKHDQLDLSNYTADVLIHAGDYSNTGLESELRDFVTWLDNQPFKHKIFISGNHDWFAQKNPGTAKEIIARLAPSVVYLENSGITIDGVKFYGSPYSNQFFDWAFMEEEVGLSKIWAKIPEDTNVLITHGPAYGHQDVVNKAYGRDPHVGSQSLTRRKKLLTGLVWHVCGHIHESYGITGNVINASILNEKYRLTNKPIEVEV